MASSRSICELRAYDSPKRWAVWFLLLYPLSAPFYAITRRNWTVLLSTLASLFALSLAWEIIRIIVMYIWAYDINGNSALDVFFTLMTWVVIALVGYRAVFVVVASARSKLQHDSNA